MSNPADKVAGFVARAVAKPVAQLQQLAGEMEATKARFEAMIAEGEQKIQAKVAELDAKLAEVDEQLGSFNSLEGDGGDIGDLDFSEYSPASNPGNEALAVRIDALDSRMLDLAGRLNAVQQEARAPSPPPEPVHTGGYAPFVTHEKLERALEDLSAGFPDVIMNWAYENSHILIEVTSPRGVKNGPSGPIVTRDAELEESLDF